MADNILDQLKAFADAQESARAGADGRRPRRRKPLAKC